MNPDPVTFNTEEVINCRPNMDYMKDNPVRATLYHKEPGKARIVKRRGLLWHTNMVREGIEVRQCAIWNEEYSMTGAWDPAPCIGKTHALKKYDQFALITSCFWGSTGSNITPVVQFHNFLLQK